MPRLPDGPIVDVITHRTGPLSAYGCLSPRGLGWPIVRRRWKNRAMRLAGRQGRRSRATTERTRCDEPHAADPARSRRRTRDVRGVGQDGVIVLEPRLPGPGRGAGTCRGSARRAAVPAASQGTPPLPKDCPPRRKPRRRRRRQSPTRRPSTGRSPSSAAASPSGWWRSSTCSSRPSCSRCRIFALIIEFIGYRTSDQRYDRLAHEFTKLLSVSFSLTGDVRRVR